MANPGLDLLSFHSESSAPAALPHTVVISLPASFSRLVSDCQSVTELTWLTKLTCAVCWHPDAYFWTPSPPIMVQLFYTLIKNITLLHNLSSFMFHLGFSEFFFRQNIKWKPNILILGIVRDCALWELVWKLLLCCYWVFRWRRTLHLTVWSLSLI